MKRIGLFLLAVVMVAGAVGMVGCSKDDKLDASDMAGTYMLAKITVTPPGTTYIPPVISGSIATTANLLRIFELARLFPYMKPPLSPFGKGG